MNASGTPQGGALASKAQILALSTPKFRKAVEDAKMVHGEQSIMVARALNELGEHCLSVYSVEDLLEAKKAFEASMKIQVGLVGGKYSKGVYVWLEGYPPEEFVDTHYKLGQVIAAQANVSGESENSRSHLQKTLGMREDYDKHMQEKIGTAKAEKLKRKMKGVAVEEEKGEQKLGNVSSGFDSTLVYSDSAEAARLDGNFKEAEFLYLKSINLRRDKFGKDNPAIAPGLVKYAETLRMQFKYKEAKKALDEALAINMSSYGGEHPATTESLNNLGQINRLLGNHDEAEALLLEALQLRRKLFGDFHVLTASTLNNLAELFRERGDYFQAISYHNAAVESFTEAEGSDHPGTINARGNLGVTLRRQAKSSLQQGETLVKEALHALQQKEYDAQHPWLVKFGMENMLAQASKLNDQGKYDESIDLYDSLISKKHVMAQLKVLGGNSKIMPNVDDDASVGSAAASVGSKTSKGLQGTRYGAQTKTGDDVSVSSAGNESMGSGLSSTRQKFRKPVSQDLIVLTEGRVEGMLNKAKKLLFKGNFGEADAVLNTALVSAWSVLGEESYLLYRGTLLHAEVKIMLAQYEFSNELLVEMLQRWTDFKGPDHVEVAYAAALLAYLYYIQGMYDASHTLYAQVAEVVGTKLAWDPLATKRTDSEHNILYCNVLLGLAKVNFKMAKFPEALAALEQAKQLMVVSVTLNSPLFLELRICYAHMRAFAGNLNGARQIYQQCLTQAVDLFGSKTHAMCAYLVHKIGCMEYSLGNLPQASAFLEEALYMRLKIFKDDHPDVAASELIKGIVITSLGRYDEAIVYIERAMVNQRVSLGPRHPMVARSLLSMASVFNRKGLPLEAAEHVKQAMDINREVFGRLEAKFGQDTMAEGDNAVAPHPVVVSTLLAQGVNEACKGHVMMAQILLERVLSEREMIYASLGELSSNGPDGEEEEYAIKNHLSLADAHFELGRVFVLQGVPNLAFQHLTQAGTAISQICGDTSMRTADVLMSLGDASCLSGCFRDAQLQYSHAAVIYTTEQGAIHPVVSFDITMRAAYNIAHVGYLIPAGHVADELLTLYQKTSQLPPEGSILAELLSLKARVLVDQGWIKEDMGPVREAIGLLKRAQNIVSEHVGEESLLYVQVSLQLCNCQLRMNEIGETDALLKKCITIARKAVEHPDNNNSGPTLDYRDKHPILGELACARAWLANPLQKPGKHNAEALKIMEKEVVPLFLAKLGDEHIKYVYFLGRCGVFRNMEQRGSGNDVLRQALKAFEEAPVTSNQLFFTNDCSWVAALGGYESARLKGLGAYNEKFGGVFSFASWAIVTKGASDSSAVGSLTSAPSKTGVIIAGVGQAPDYPECPPADAIFLSDSPEISMWGAVAANSGAPVTKKDKKKISGPSSGGGILALAIFNGEAPISMAIADIFGTGGESINQSLALQKAEARARQAAADFEQEALAQQGLDEGLDDHSSIVSNSSIGEGTGEEERAALEKLRAEHQQELQDMESIREQRRKEEDVMLAVKAQREAEEDLFAKAKEDLLKFQLEMDEFKKKHQEELEKVKAEMLAAQAGAETVNDAVAVAEPTAVDVAVDDNDDDLLLPGANDTTVIPSFDNVVASDASFTGTAAGDNSPRIASMNAGDRGDTVVSATVAIALNGNEDTVDKTKPAENDVSGTESAAVQAKPLPIVVQAATSNNKARTALDAASFLFDRAVDFRAKGWYAKSNPILAECLSIREAFIAECAQMGTNAESLCAQTKLEHALNLMDMCLWSEAIKPLEDIYDVRKEQSKAKGGGSNGLGNGKSRELADVLEAQAKNYYFLSMYSEAQQKFLDAVKMRTDTSNAGDPQIGRCICAQALNMSAQGKFLEAKATAEKGHAILTKAYGTKNVHTAEGFMARIIILAAMGKHKDANPLMQQCMSIRRRLLDGSHPLIAEACLLTATTLIDQDRYVEAEKWVKDATDMYLVYFDEEDVRVSAARQVHARLLRLYGKYQEAIELQTELYRWRKDFIVVPAKAAKPVPPTEEELKRAAAKKKIDDDWDVEIDGPRPEPEVVAPVVIALINGGEHQLISESLLELAQCHILIGDYTQGNNYVKAALKMRKSIYADCLVNPHVAEALYWRGEGLRGLGDMDRARQNHDDALDLRRRCFGKDHASFALSQCALANILRNRGLYEDSEGMYRKALKLQQSVCSDESVETADTLNSYAECLRFRGNFALALENNTAAMNVYKMQFNVVNPYHPSIIECNVNRSLIELDMLIPPPIVPNASPTGGEDDDEDDDTDVNYHGDESVTDDAESTAQSKAPSLIPRKESPGFVLGDGIAVPRDENGVAIFLNQEYIRIRGIFQAAQATLLEIFETAELRKITHLEGKKKDKTSPEGSAKVRATEYCTMHPLSVNLSGNVAVVDKLEAEAKMRFLFSLTKDDRKLFESAEKRALLEEPSKIETRVVAECEDSNMDDKSVQSAGGESVSSNTRNTQAAVPDDEKLPQFMLDLDDVLARLLQIGIEESHPWMRKFRAYRLIIEKPPDEMSVAMLSFKEAEKFKRKGIYAQADQKYDEAISMQVEHLGHIQAGTNPAVAASVYAKAHISRIQCKFSQARQFYMQSFSIHLKIDGILDDENGLEESVQSRAGSPTPGVHPPIEVQGAETALSEGCARAYYGLAEIYRVQGQADTAQAMHEKVFDMRTRLHIIKGKFISKGKPAYRNHPSIMQSLAALSELALGRGDLLEAREHAEAAMSMCVHLGRDEVACYFVDDYGNVCDLKRLLGRICLAEGLFTQAEDHFLCAQALRFEALAPLFGAPARESTEHVPASGDSVTSSVRAAKTDDHPDCSHDYYDLAKCYLALQRLPEAKKLIAKCMKLRLKFFGRLKSNSVKLTLTSKQFLENLLESDTYPEVDMIEKRLITQAGTTSGGVGDKINEAFARDPAASNDYDLTSVLEDGSIGEASVDQAGAQYVASHAVVIKALEIPTSLDGERLPAFVYRNVPVSNHNYIADALAMRAEVALNMGDLEESRIMCESALNIRKELMGRKSLATGQSLYQLARITQLCGVLSEAMSLHVMAADIKTQFLPNSDQHPELVDSLVSIGELKLLLSNLDEGHIKIQSAADKTIHVYGKEHVRCADVWLAHSEYFRLIADYSKASTLVQRALKVYKTVLPEYHGKIGLALCQEARVQIQLGMLDIAYTLIEQGMSNFTMVYSDSHYYSVSSQLIRADILLRRGKILEAKSVIEMCLTSRRDMFGKQNWQTAYSLYYLAVNLFGLGRYITAQPIFERAVQLMRRALGTENLMVATAMSALGDCYVQNAEYDKAKSIYETALHIRIRLTSYRRGGSIKDAGQNATNMHPDVADSQSSIAELDLLHGNFGLAVQGFDDALAMRRATLGHMHPAVADSMHSLGCCYFAQGLLLEAKQIFERALKMRKTVLPADHFQIQDTQLYLARVNQAQGKLEQASAMYERCLINLRICRGSRHPTIGKVLYCLGDVSNELGNYDLALSFFLDSLVIRKASFGISIQAPEVKEKLVPGSVVMKKKKKPETLPEDLPLPKKDKFHPEIAETLFGMAESYRLKGLYAKPEANVFSDKGADLIKKDSGVVTAADLAAIEAANKALENGGSVVSKISRGLDEPSLSISMSTPGKHELEAYEDKSVATVGMANIEGKLKLLDEDIAGDFDDASTLGDGSHMGLNDYGRAHDSPIKNTPIKTETRQQFDTEVEYEKDEDEEFKYAMPLYERCLDMILTIFGNEHPIVYGIQHAIAATLQALGNYMLSHDLFQHVLSHRRRILGDNHLHTCDSMQGVADILRSMSHVWPTNNAAAAEKRVKKIKVTKGIGPTLTEYLSSILGADDRLKNQWPPEVTHDLTLIAAGRGKVVMHPLLQRKSVKPTSKYIGGYMGYQYSAPKKLQRDRRFIEANVTRPTISFLTDAKWLYDTALAGCRVTFGEHAEHPVIAGLLFGKAELMRARKENDEAMTLYELSLNMRRHILKGTHPAIADCLVGMAETLRYENKFTKAEPLLIKAIQIRQNAYASGDSHPSIPDGQCSLAMLYFSMGRYLEAQPLFSESLHTRERILGKAHIATAQSLNNYAGLLHTTGKFEKALPYYRRALEIKIEALGEDHPDVASAKNNIGLLLKAMGKHDESKEMYDEALESLRRVFGELHADVASTLNNMAALYVAMGNIQKGKDLYRESLHIKKKVLGIDHTAVAASLNNLAGLCFSCNEIDDAKDYYEESLRIRRTVYGDDHVTVAESLNNIGLLLFAQGDFVASQPLFERSIEIKSASYGGNHISTASSQHNLAILFHKLKRFTEAEELYTIALEVRTDVLGPQHPDTINTMDNMNTLQVDKSRGVGSTQPLTPMTALNNQMQVDIALSGTILQNGLGSDSRYLVGKNISRAQTPKRADDSVQSVASALSQNDSDDGSFT